MDSFSRMIGKRFRIARKSRSTTQDAVAAALGFNDRQSVSAIEVGERRVTPEELLKAAAFFEESIEFFTDPYFVAERHDFSYRSKWPAAPGSLQDFQRQAETLISAQRRFRDLLGETASPVHSQLREIARGTSYDDAILCGEQTAASWGLGEIPALRLRETAEEKLGISILFIDGMPGVSGAACHLDDGDVIVINRLETQGGRNVTLGHELFHILTWDVMPPNSLDIELEGGQRQKEKCELLAENYANGLLMPTHAIKQRWASRHNDDFPTWLLHHSRDLHVTPAALYLRMVDLGVLSQDKVPLPHCPADTIVETVTPPIYSRPFATQLQKVLDRGHLSVIRATELLDCSIGDLADTLNSYDLEVPFNC